MFTDPSSKYTHLNDGELLRQYQNSHELEKLAVLYHRYMHLVYAVSFKYLRNSEDSKDAVMHIFEKLIETVKKQEIRNFRPWLHVVTKNHCLMALRAQKKNVELDGSVMELGTHLHPNGEENQYDLDKLAKALVNLPEHQRICIELFYYKSKSYQEIALETGFELKKVKSYIQNGKRNLKGYMDKT